jgi:simple sugar transport system ATP-binding protein
MTFAVEFKNVSKSFDNVLANQSISLKIKKGSIHAIIGENGAGKSTAMKILYGTYAPDSGDIYINEQLWGGRRKVWSSPADAIQAGIGMVHQHFMLASSHSVLENVLLGVEPSARFWNWLPSGLRPLDRRKARNRLHELGMQYGLRVDLDAKIEDLPVGAQQKIEILKLLYREAKILILDEPTAVLTPRETSDLFENLKKLSSQGKTVIIITHKLKEVMNLAHFVTTFRAGQVVGEQAVGDTQIEDLASLMVGRKVKLEHQAPSKPVLRGKVLEMRGVFMTGAHPLHQIELSVNAGEVVGISGVEGNGQTELIEAIMHPREYTLQKPSHLAGKGKSISGSIELFGRNLFKLRTQQIKAMGVGLVPDDRHRDALLLNRPVSESFILGLQRMRPLSRFGILSQVEVDRLTQKVVENYDIRPQSIRILASALSGGNQQKYVIAREMHIDPKFLIAAQPTRGVDVGAVEMIHRRILKARDEGCGILLISSELDEILALSDRILVMYEGRISAEFARGCVTEQELGLRMGGAHS